MSIVTRDPFARSELHRESVRIAGRECDWCGCRTKTLYEYGTERDGVAASYTARRKHRGLFCSTECFDSWHS